MSKIYIYGKHAITEALRSVPNSVKKVHIAKNFDDKDVLKLIADSKVETAVLSKNEESASEGPHQGLVGVVSVYDLVQGYDSFIENLAVTPDTSLVILGEIQDPHNVGAIIRTAAAFGIAGVIMPENNPAPITGTVVKVSAGMAFKVPLVKVGNINQTIADLKKRGFWIYGLAGEGANSLPKEKFDAPAVFIVGNEGKGVREKTREACDVLLSIPMDPKCESLNAAASAAVALYAWSAQHPEALKK